MVLIRAAYVIRCKGSRHRTCGLVDSPCSLALVPPCRPPSHQLAHGSLLVDFALGGQRSRGGGPPKCRRPTPTSTHILCEDPSVPPGGLPCFPHGGSALGFTKALHRWYKDFTKGSNPFGAVLERYVNGVSVRAARFIMANDEPISKEILLSLGVRWRGTVFKYWTCQMSHGGQQVRRYSKPRDPKTPGQISCRAKFAQAVLFGQGLDIDARLYWGKIGVRKLEPITWFNAVVQAYVKDFVDLNTKRHIRNLQTR